MNASADSKQLAMRRTMGSCRAVGLALMATFVVGCQSSGSGSERGSSARRASSRGGHSDQRIKRVRCIYGQKPWLNLDSAGDRDPEGVHFRAFLGPGEGRCVLRDGTFHIEMYQLSRVNHEVSDRTLISEWHYSTNDFTTVDSKMLGRGYHLRLRWATKDVANQEVELIVRFEDNEGNSARSGTKRFRVPKYVS